MSRLVTDIALNVAFCRRWMADLLAAIDENCEKLTRLDAAIGDADHGINMLRGMKAVVAALDDADPATPAEALNLVANQLIKVVGGAGGPLYGSAFRGMASSLGDALEGGISDLAGAMTGGLTAVQRLGAAEVGDKTMVDAWVPAAAELERRARAGDGPVTALAATVEAAEQGMVSTIPLRALKGRASYLGWRSEGHQDPGATSTHLLFVTLAANLQ